MYEVLVPIHTSVDRAISQASFVADLPSASTDVNATLLFIFTGRERAKDTPEELQRFDSPTRIEAVRRAMDHLDEADVAYSVREDSGEVAQDIIDIGEDLDVDLIVLGGRKRSPTGKILFGSVTQDVLLNTDRPVTVTSPTED